MSVTVIEETTARRSVLRSAVGIGLYAGAFGASFGAVATGSGLSVGQAMALSLVMFSGASQSGNALLLAKNHNVEAAPHN